MITHLWLRLSLRQPYIKRGQRCDLWMPAYGLGSVALHRCPDPGHTTWVISSSVTGEKLGRWPTFCAAWRALPVLADVQPPDRCALNVASYLVAVLPIRVRVEMAGGVVFDPAEYDAPTMKTRK